MPGRPREYRPDVLGALAGFSVAISVFAGVHLVLFVDRASAGGLDRAEKAWAALGVGLVLAGLLNAFFIRRVLTTPRGPGARRET